MKYNKIFLGLSLLLPSSVFANTKQTIKPIQYKFGPVDVIPISKENADKYTYNENEYWVKGTDIVDNFSIEDAKKYYNTLYKTLHENFVKPVSYKDITNKILEGLSGFVEQLKMNTTENRILIYDKNYKLIGNFKKTGDEDVNNWVNILLNTILSLRKNNKKIADANQEQIYYTTTLYLLKSLDENANYTDPINTQKKKEALASTSLGFTYRKTTFGLQVLSILNDSPIYFSDIKTGDLITHINNIPTRSLTDEQIEYLLTSTDTDIMYLTYIPYISNIPARVFIRKNKISIPSTNAEIVDDIPVITINNFKKGSSRELKKSFDTIKNQKMPGLILDLRGNINGLADEAIESANLFINSREILRASNSKEDETQTYTTKSGDISNNLPIVIIIDNTTKGPAEIFASIFEGVNRAVVIGTPSFGIGTISKTFDLPNGGEIEFATYDTLNAKNISTNKTGVVPLICTSSIFSEKDITTLKTNIIKNRFVDNRPTNNNNSAETINNIRNSCRAIYPNKDTQNLTLKIATNIVRDNVVYNKLLNKQNQ